MDPEREIQSSRRGQLRGYDNLAGPTQPASHTGQTSEEQSNYPQASGIKQETMSQQKTGHLTSHPLMAEPGPPYLGAPQHPPEQQQPTGQHNYPPGMHQPSGSYASPPHSENHGHPSMAHPGAPPPSYVAGPGVVITSQPMGITQPMNLHSGMLPGNFARPQAPIPMIPIGPIPGCPPGLEYLTQLDTLFVRQMIELLEAFTGWETKNKYVVCDSASRLVFYAKEDSSFCARNCCGPIRAFDMVIVDASGHEIIHLKRPLACGSCCFPCCLQSIQVFSPPDNLIGTVEQEWSICFPEYVVRNELGKKVLRIRGPCMTCSCCGSDVEFKILSFDGEDEVGKISKKWSGLAMEYFTDADNFGIQFPMDLDVKMKATMLGACMLIDFMFFEHNQK